MFKDQLKNAFSIINEPDRIENMMKLRKEIRNNRFQKKLESASAMKKPKKEPHFVDLIKLSDESANLVVELFKDKQDFVVYLYDKMNAPEEKEENGIVYKMNSCTFDELLEFIDSELEKFESFHSSIGLQSNINIEEQDKKAKMEAELNKDAETISELTDKIDKFENNYNKIMYDGYGRQIENEDNEICEGFFCELYDAFDLKRLSEMSSERIKSLKDNKCFYNIIRLSICKTRLIEMNKELSELLDKRGQKDNKMTLETQFSVS